MDLIRVSQQIRELRKSQGLTVEQLANKSGLSKAFISRLENFRVNPSLNALNRITAALGISMSAFFNENASAPSVIFGQLGEGEPIDRDNAGAFGMNYFSLAYKKYDRVMEPFLIEYRPSDQRREFLMHPDDEFFLLLEGEVDFYIGEETNRKTIGAGATVYLSKNIPHTVRLREGCALAKALVVYGRGAVTTA